MTLTYTNIDSNFQYRACISFYNYFSWLVEIINKTLYSARITYFLREVPSKRRIDYYYDDGVGYLLSCSVTPVVVRNVPIIIVPNKELCPKTVETQNVDCPMRHRVDCFFVYSQGWKKYRFYLKKKSTYVLFYFKDIFLNNLK